MGIFDSRQDWLSTGVDVGINWQFVVNDQSLLFTTAPVVLANIRRRVRPNYNGISARENSSSTNYISFTAKADRRFTNGFTLLSSFTKSHNIDFVGEFLNNNETHAPFRVHYNP